MVHTLKALTNTHATSKHTWVKLARSKLSKRKLVVISWLLKWRTNMNDLVKIIFAHLHYSIIIILFFLFNHHLLYMFHSCMFFCFIVITIFFIFTLVVTFNININIIIFILLSSRYVEQLNRSHPVIHLIDIFR